MYTRLELCSPDSRRFRARGLRILRLHRPASTAMCDVIGWVCGRFWFRFAMGMGGQEQPVVAAVPVQDPADPVDMKARRRALLRKMSSQ